MADSSQKYCQFNAIVFVIYKRTYSLVDGMTVVQKTRALALYHVIAIQDPSVLFFCRLASKSRILSGSLHVVSMIIVAMACLNHKNCLTVSKK